MRISYYAKERRKNGAKAWAEAKKRAKLWGVDWSRLWARRTAWFEYKVYWADGEKPSGASRMGDWELRHFIKDGPIWEGPADNASHAKAKALNYLVGKEIERDKAVTERLNQKFNIGQ